MKQKTDWNLKFFREVFNLESLHFGYWEETQEINLENLKLAQNRYIEVLCSKIPPEIKTILDVGAGTGEITKLLYQKGYEVESVSPDEYQYKIFKSKCHQIKFYLSRFKDLNINKSYDLILMAESCQYLKLGKIFPKCLQLLNTNGYLLVADYFRKQNTKFYHTTHVLSQFFDEARKYNFKIILDEDITKKVLPTLLLGRKIYTTYVLPSIEILAGYFVDKYPLLTKIINLLFFNKIRKIEYYIYTHTKKKLDIEEFEHKMSYRIILLKNSFQSTVMQGF